ncbi:flagellar basal-body MS-ring/collar protein FliF [Nocardioides sp. SR21]|uniref:flagellar basal-body MS-ring/collar protein FliF n=1 Tax=Nocardioides sp. SR21 TaxID=2919501 RepID=UPI001FAA1026|nr:flagellar basal-body MS-ring/collar protein FliF [Nocardioides sp. SR21]
MKQNLNRTLTRVRTTFMAFTPGQRVITVVGVAALVLAAFMVFRWVSTPNYAPLYSNLASEDASAIVDELAAEGTPYQLADGGGTIMVPRDDVYSTRIALSGKGLPESGGDTGYSLLDGQDISTSEFQEQTDFKRAMEGELANTIEAVDGVNTAIVHLALPEKEVFSDEQDPPTASILIDTSAGTTLEPEQVQGVVHLVASSIDGLDPADVTVTDASGKVLSNGDDGGAMGASSRDQQLNDFQQATVKRIQTMLDTVLGPGNSIVQVTADLDFDKSIQESTTYDKADDAPVISSSENTEKYSGPAGAGGATGVVGPDGQMDSFTNGTGGNSAYQKRSITLDNGVGKTVEHRETAPGSVNSMHVGAVLDTTAAQAVNVADVQELIEGTLGINLKRGDTVEVSTMPFDRTADEAAAAELAAAAKAAKDAETWKLARNLGIGVAILLIVLLAWLSARRRAKKKEEQTAYLVEQLRLDAADRAASAVAIEPNPALAALEAAEHNAADEMRLELANLADGQPEDVATLLRGWLVERS